LYEPYIVHRYQIYDEQYRARKDNFRKSLENNLCITIKPKKYEEDLHTLFTLDILKAGDKEKIKAAMKNRFDEKCAPYIKKFVTAMNNADVR
ncbi:MAG: hypothetical protein K2N67_07120, partial [Mucispirillum sp.]|nr:hypothetical protein [Mucispirillum sp.]